MEDAKNGEALKDALDFTTSKTLQSGAKFVWDGIEISPEDVKDGAVLALKFNVNKDTEPGKYPITIKYTDGDIVNNDLESVDLQTINGYITVEESR